MPKGLALLAEPLAALPDNHRRVVVAVLELFLRHLAQLVQEGLAAAEEADLRELERLWIELRGGKPTPNWEAVRSLLQVQLEELEPQRLAAYGPLTEEQRGTVAALVQWLRSSLEPKKG
ncbi:MAG: hypothetical protein NZ869_03690 [Thermoanaerobaculum sp.]|nr:hypothetical protein [Thermoanaerobaculum sp.]MDW7968032.1 hypothetical protein [Thermoanaerobaculum sp.]